MKIIGAITIMLFIALPCFAENYLLNGGQTSHIQYTMVQEIVPAYGTKRLILSYVVPKTFTSPSYNQVIQAFDLKFSQNPQFIEKAVDKRGNEVRRAIWMWPKRRIKVTISIDAFNRTNLEPLEPEAAFPLKNLPPEVQVYLTPTKQAPAAHPEIVRKAKSLTSMALTQIDAIQQILAWIVDRMTYVQSPQSYEALYSFRTGKGNCQNYSHLSAALMRAAGIPVRIVNGITLKEAYNVKISGGYLTMRMAQGRHSWIEVYFPDLGWVPFDPQQMQLFVSNRFIRVEVGLDNRETVGDGTVSWTKIRGTSGRPQFRELIGAKFISDEVNLSAERQSYGPRKMLFTPPVEASFSAVAFEDAPAAPISRSPENLQDLTYNEQFVFGNLDFPRNIDFLEVQGPIEEVEDSVMVMRKSFLVETSEYVTTKGQKYSQTFILEHPLQLEEAGLALHNFGGDGQLWIEVLKDDGSGKPGEYLTSSDIIPLGEIKYSQGYDWVNFKFSKENQLLSPGRYWIALGYTGSPVINWFFTYGKPVGPADGTRYITMFDETWSHSLVYEFNYRIVGMKGR